MVCPFVKHGYSMQQYWHDEDIDICSSVCSLRWQHVTTLRVSGDLRLDSPCSVFFEVQNYDPESNWIDMHQLVESYPSHFDILDLFVC